MPEVIRTHIYRLRHNPSASQGIGYLVSQQNMAYNRGVEILRKYPDMVLWPRKPSPRCFKSETLRWMKSDGRANCPEHLLIAGAEQARDYNDCLKRQRTLDRLREDNEHAEARDGLRHRSRKQGRAVLTSHKPLDRIAADKFAVPGVNDLIVHTKEPVPDLGILSFRIVEVQGDRHGANRPLRKRRYALHLNVIETYPDPAATDSIKALDDVLGIEGANGERLALSSGGEIAFDDSKSVRRERAMRSTAARKKKDSNQQKKLFRQLRKSSKRRRAERRRFATRAARVLLKELQPRLLAISPESFRATSPPVKNINSLTSRRHGPSMVPVLSEIEEAMVAEARRQGVATYTLIPQFSGTDYNYCRHRDDRETQAESRCRRCRREPNTNQDTAHDLQKRAFHYIGPAAGRTLYEEEPTTGRRVKPSRAARDLSCDTQGADKLKSDHGQQGAGPELSPPNDLLGVSLQAGSPSEQGAQRQLFSRVSTQYIITDEIYTIINMINGEDLAYNTKKLRAEGMAMWATWATINRQRIIPAEPASVATFLARLAELGRSTLTITGYLKGVVTYHEMLGLDSPVTNQVRKVKQGIERLHGKWGKQAPGLSRKAMKAIEQTAFTPLSHETPEQTMERGQKIIALVNLMRDCLLRRSEAASATWGDISPYDDDGSGALFVKRSKTDRSGEGAALYVSRETMDALSAIRNGASDCDTIFGWTADQITYRMKQSSRIAGLNEAFSTHSMRRGMAQELIRENATIEELKEAGRWDDDSISVRYGLPNDPKEGAIAQYYALVAAHEKQAEE